MAIKETFADEIDAMGEAFALHESGWRHARVERSRYGGGWDVYRGPVNVNVRPPERYDPAWLFTLVIGGYRIRAWEVGTRAADLRSHRMHTPCGVIVTRIGAPHVPVMLCDDIGLSPAFSIDGPEARSGVVGWVAEELDDENLSLESDARFGGAR